jgi:hypothetical protein
VVEYDAGDASPVQFFEEVKAFRKAYDLGKGLVSSFNGATVSFFNNAYDCPKEQFLKAFDELIEVVQPKRQVFTLEVELVGADGICFSEIERDLLSPNVNYDRGWDCRYDIESVKVLSCQDKEEQGQ